MFQYLWQEFWVWNIIFFYYLTCCLKVYWDYNFKINIASFSSLEFIHGPYPEFRWAACIFSLMWATQNGYLVANKYNAASVFLRRKKQSWRHKSWNVCTEISYWNFMWYTRIQIFLCLEWVWIAESVKVTSGLRFRAESWECVWGMEV